MMYIHILHSFLKHFFIISITFLYIITWYSTQYQYTVLVFRYITKTRFYSLSLMLFTPYIYTQNISKIRCIISRTSSSIGIFIILIIFYIATSVFTLIDINIHIYFPLDTSVIHHGTVN